MFTQQRIYVFYFIELNFNEGNHFTSKPLEYYVYHVILTPKCYTFTDILEYFFLFNVLK